MGLSRQTSLLVNNWKTDHIYLVQVNVYEKAFLTMYCSKIAVSTLRLNLIS